MEFVTAASPQVWWQLDPRDLLLLVLGAVVGSLVTGLFAGLGKALGRARKVAGQRYLAWLTEADAPSAWLSSWHDHHTVLRLINPGPLTARNVRVWVARKAGGAQGVTVEADVVAIGGHLEVAPDQPNVDPWNRTYTISWTVTGRKHNAPRWQIWLRRGRVEIEVLALLELDRESRKDFQQLVSKNPPEAWEWNEGRRRIATEAYPEVFMAQPPDSP